MKLRTSVTALLILLMTAGMALAEGNWHTSYDAAVKESQKTNKPILMDFTGSDWCGWCIKLQKEVFSTPEFQAWAEDNVVLLELDFPRGKEQPAEIEAQNKELAAKYSIEGFPTVLFTDSEGEVLGKYGYDKGGPEVWTKKADEMIK